ncbi:MAG: PadR family transcriptional regulator [Gemmatimonadota bacterium]|nr:MAG: PadR family transcriptional regulator [Gemmatimonadota bacterium]
MPKALGEFEILILFAIIRLKDEAYGATIHREIEERTGRSIAIGAVYTGLARLQRNSHVEATVGNPTPQRGGRRKKYYRIQPAGAWALSMSVQAYRQMTEGIERELDLVFSDVGTRRNT